MSASDDKDHSSNSKIEEFKPGFVIKVVQFNIVLYASCFWIQQSCFPYMSKKLGVDTITYGYLQTAFAVAQLAGGPVFGRFGDLFGARAALSIAFGSGVLTYAMLGLATSVPMLFFSRFLSIFLACMQGSQMVITDLVPVERRADALGKLGLFYGIGMVIGPTVGGQITKTFGEEAAALTAATGSLVSIFITLYFVPKHVKHVKAEDQNVANVFSISEITKVLACKGAAFLMAVKIVVGIPIGVLQSVFSRVAMDQFELPANYNGFVMSYIGIVTMLVQGVGVGVLTKKYSDMSLMKFGTVIATCAYLLISQVTGIYQFCVAIFPLIVGMTTMQVVIGAALTKTVASRDTGTMIGLSMATNSIIRAVSPTMGGYMLEMLGYPSIGYTGVVICGIVSALLFMY